MTEKYILVTDEEYCYTLDTKSENTIIKSEPTFNGLVMNFDVSFKQKNDFVKYKVVVKNDTNIDYKIANDTSFNKSDHITYTYDVENILKPKGEAVVYVTITYSSEVDPSELVDGMYKEENKAVIQLLNKDGKVENPNTGINYILFISILLTIINRAFNEIFFQWTHRLFFDRIIMVIV